MSYPLQQLAKPIGISINDWKIALKKAKLVKEAFENGRAWNTDLFINSKEFFQLISTPDGRVMIGNDTTLKFGKNQNINNWVNELNIQAIQAIEENDFNQAEIHLATWRLIEPQSEEMQLLIGLVYFKQNKNHQAWKTLTRIINNTPSFDKAYYLRALVLNKVSKYDEALEDLNLYLRKSPEDFNAIYLKTRILSSLGKLKIATNYISTLFNQQPNFNLGKLLIELLVSNRDYKAAENVFNFISRDGEKSASKAYQLAKLAKLAKLESEFWKYLFFAKEKQHPKAMELWKSITHKKTSIAA